MSIYDYTWPYWPRDKRIIEKKLPAHGMGAVSIKTAPQVEPVSLDEVKLFARVDGSVEDALLETLIVASRRAIENYLKKAIIEQTLVLSMDWWPEPLNLPRPPLLSVVEVRTVAEDGTTTTYSSDYYYVRTDTTPGQIIIRNGVTPPLNTDRYYGGYEVEYKAGYGNDPNDVPETIRHGLLLLVTHLYENRSPVLDGVTISAVPGLAEVLGQERRIRL